MEIHRLILHLKKKRKYQYLRLTLEPILSVKIFYKLTGLGCIHSV